MSQLEHVSTGIGFQLQQVNYFTIVLSRRISYTLEELEQSNLEKNFFIPNTQLLFLLKNVEKDEVVVCL